MIYRGTIAEVLDRPSDFHITYDEDRGGSSVFTIQKHEALKAAFIAASTGHRVEVHTADRSMVCEVRIDDQLVLKR